MEFGMVPPLRAWRMDVKAPNRREAPRRRLAAAAIAAVLFAATLPGAAASDAESVALDVEAVNEHLDARGIALTAEAVRPVDVPGMYEVAISDDQYLYVTANMRFMIVGDLYELPADPNADVVAVTEGQRRTKRIKLLAGEAAADALAFAPDAQAKASVLVFTDTDCGFCRRLHTAMDEYHAHGIEVRYLAYPRAGVGSPTYEKMVSAWCADDPQGALTALKRGDEIPQKSCVNPVAEHYELGQSVGITGTPSILLPNGDLLPGLVDADRLAERLGL